jgi:hypothetical protein
MRVDGGVQVVSGVVGVLRHRKRQVGVEPPDGDVHESSG